MSVVFKRSILKPFSSGALSAGVAQLSQEYTVDEFQAASLLVDLTAVSGSPSSYSLDVKLQYSPDTSGSRWFDLPSGAITQITSVTNQRIDNILLLTARRLRISYTLAFVGGTTPTATFGVDLSLVTNYASTRTASVGGDVAAGATDSGNPLKMGSVYKSTPATRTNGQRCDIVSDENENLKTTDATKGAGEDLVNDRLMVEERFSYAPVASADVQVKGGAGFLKGFILACNDAVPTAGSLIIYNSLSETGEQIANMHFEAVFFNPVFIAVNASFAIGLYLGFTTTADVNVTPIYR